MIKLEHVSKAYSAGVPAVNDVNLEIDDGEFVFIVGGQENHDGIRVLGLYQLAQFKTVPVRQVDVQQH